MELTNAEKLQLDLDFDSALVKLIYAFIWQEWVITDNPMVFDPEVNVQGNALITTVNAFANSLNNFPIYDQNLQVWINISKVF